MGKQEKGKCGILFSISTVFIKRDWIGKKKNANTQMMFDNNIKQIKYIYVIILNNIYLVLLYIL